MRPGRSRVRGTVVTRVTDTNQDPPTTAGREEGRLTGAGAGDKAAPPRAPGPYPDAIRPTLLRGARVRSFRRPAVLQPQRRPRRQGPLATVALEARRGSGALA